MKEIEPLAQDSFDPVILTIITNFKEELAKYKSKSSDSVIAKYLNSQDVANHGIWKMKNEDIVIASKSGDHSSINGPAVVYFKDETLYIGNLLNTHRSGRGYRTYKGSKLVYWGEYANDVKSGKGRLYSLEGKKWVFDGNYANDVRNGHGNLQKLDGHILWEFRE